MSRIADRHVPGTVTVRNGFGRGMSAGLVIALVIAAPIAAASALPTQAQPATTRPAPAPAPAGRAMNRALVPEAPVDVAEEFATDHLLVRLAPGASITFEARGAVVRDQAGQRRPIVEQALSIVGVRGIVPALTRAPAHPEIAARVGLDRHHRLLLAPGADPIAALDALRNVGGGAGGVADRVLEIVELDPIGGVASDPLIPNDPNFSLQWSMLNSGQVVGGIAGTPGADISAPEAWAITTGDPIVVAVLDSGVNLHPELAGRVLAGTNIPNPDIGTADGCASHGTHVSGTLAARGDNLVGISGMSWAAEIMPIVVVNPCSGLESFVADGLVWATDEGARIANMSLQYSVGSAYLKAAVEYAYALDVVMIAATGNSNSAVAFPARWPETIAIAATNNLDQRWLSSNFGPEVDLAAPGVNIWSLSGMTGYAYKTGTSFSAPHVSGTVALMLTVNPNLDTEQIRQILRSTADDVDAPGFDIFTGHGRLNAAAALAATLDTVTPTADLNGDGTVDGADLGILLNAWGSCAGSPCLGDLNGDGVVDGADLGILLNAWGSGPPS